MDASDIHVMYIFYFFCFVFGTSVLWSLANIRHMNAYLFPRFRRRRRRVRWCALEWCCRYRWYIVGFRSGCECTENFRLSCVEDERTCSRERRELVPIVHSCPAGGLHVVSERCHWVANGCAALWWTPTSAACSLRSPGGAELAANYLTPPYCSLKLASFFPSNSSSQTFTIYQYCNYKDDYNLGTAIRDGRAPHSRDVGGPSWGSGGASCNEIPQRGPGMQSPGRQRFFLYYIRKKIAKYGEIAQFVNIGTNPGHQAKNGTNGRPAELWSLFRDTSLKIGTVPENPRRMVSLCNYMYVSPSWPV